MKGFPSVLPRLAAFGLLCGTAFPVAAHEFFSTKITWSREVSRIVFKSCVGCHRPGGAFSLLTFEEARPWAAAIKEEVLNRRMPPWGAVKGFGSFENDRGLSQDEISLLADWVEGGAPEGQRIYLPKAPSPLPSAQLARKNLPAAGALLPQRPLARPMRVGAIVPRGSVPAGVQLTVELPDGSVEPLIWILDPKSAVKRDFVLREPREFPAGSRFVLSKPGGLWRLLPTAGIRP